MPAMGGEESGMLLILQTRGKVMKKMLSICAVLLSTTVFAEEHTAAALEHANAAAAHGGAGQTPILLNHTKAALEHALAATKAAKDVPKNHLDNAIKELQEADELGNLGHIGSATAHAEAAVKHIKIGTKYIDPVANTQKH